MNSQNKRYLGQDNLGRIPNAGASVHVIGVCHPPGMDVFTNLETL